MSSPPGGSVPRPDHAVLEVDKPVHGFAAAHFSVLDEGTEPLHGHNYRVRLRASGAVRGDGSVVDFASLKAAIAAECEALDHSVLLPTGSDRVAVSERGDGHVEVREGERCFVFPRAEVRLLPIVNTTCECLAGHLLAGVRRRLGEAPVRLELSVEESPGQGATVAEAPPPG